MALNRSFSQIGKFKIKKEKNKMTIQESYNENHESATSVTRRIRASALIVCFAGERKDNSKPSSDGESGGDDSGDEIHGRKKAQARRNNKQLEVKLIFVEVDDEEQEERLNRIAGVMIDSALSELGITNQRWTKNEDKLQ
jgi:hypothetical protein